MNILWLWPDILSQHGDRGNAMALVRVCGLYGIDAKVERVTRLTDDFSFDGVDIALLGAGELRVMPSVIGALQKKFSGLQSWLNGGGVLFATGTSGAALGVHTVRLDGSHIYGLGLLDMECRERGIVLGDDLIVTPGDNALCGFENSSTNIYGIQIQMMDVLLADGQEPFGKTVYGYGNNGSGFDGAISGAGDGALDDASDDVSGKVIFTNALGPVLVKNPWLTVDLINLALSAKGADAADSILAFKPELFGVELASAKAIQKFNDTKERPKK